MVPSFAGSMEAKRVKTASYSTDLEGLILIRTNDHRDTLSKYEQLHRAIERAYRNRTAPAERMPAEALYGPLETFRAWAQRMRQVKEGMRVDQLWGLMLCQVPGRPGRRVDMHRCMPICHWQSDACVYCTVRPSVWPARQPCQTHMQAVSLCHHTTDSKPCALLTLEAKALLQGVLVLPVGCL